MNMRKLREMMTFILMTSAFLAVFFLLQLLTAPREQLSDGEVIINSERTGDVLKGASPKLRKAIEEWRECIKDKFGPVKHEAKDLWHHLRGGCNHCAEKTAIHWIKDNMTAIKNKDEWKYHIMAKEKSPIVVVTLGIGKDVLAEKQLKDKLPSGTEFYGADPIYEENSELFQSVGTYYPFAVGAYTGTFTANVYRKGKYIPVTLAHIDMITFLRDIVGHTRIDQLLMDNEGPEYDLLPKMSIGAAFDKEGIVICQINTEIHDTKSDPIVNGKFVKLVDDILYGNRWLPLEVYTTVHQRIYMVNIENEYCRTTYLEQFYV